MPTPAQKLATAIDQTLDRIISVTASDQADYSIQGRSMSKGTYLTQLNDTLAKLVAQRAALGGPFMVTSFGR